ncbi:glycosyl hydrolase family 17 protein [Chloroflexota bacterium]
MGGLEKTGKIAHQLGLKVAQGAWLDADLISNEEEISNLIKAAKAGFLDIAVVGGEVLLRDDLSEEQLIQYINRVKQTLPEIPVAVAMEFSEIRHHPDVVSSVDVLLVSYYPFWEGVSIDEAIATLHTWHEEIKANFGNKEIIVGESGWPSCGDTFGDAVPSPETANYYFLNFISWTRANNVSYFYFEAFDEQWKATYEGSPNACWGIWDRNGNMKPQLHEVFEGKTIQDNWSGH